MPRPQTRRTGPSNKSVPIGTREDFDFLIGFSVVDYAALLISLKIETFKEKQDIDQSLWHEADIQNAFKIFQEGQSMDISLRKAADCVTKLNGMHPDQIMVVIDFALSHINSRPSLLFYSHATKRHNRQQVLAETGKKRTREAEERFGTLSDIANSHDRDLRVEKKARSQAENNLFASHEQQMQLSRRGADLEKQLAEANTRAGTAERATAKAVADKEAAFAKIRCPICYDKGLEKVTSCGHGFCRECYDEHFQIPKGGVPDLTFLPCPSCRTMVFATESVIIHGLG